MNIFDRLETPGFRSDSSFGSCGRSNLSYVMLYYWPEGTFGPDPLLGELNQD